MMTGSIAFIALFSGGATAAFFWLFSDRWILQRGRFRPWKPARLAPCVFLFQNEKLVDATAPAKAILEHCSGSDLASLEIWLARHFDGMENLRRQLADNVAGYLTSRRAGGFAGFRVLAEKIPGDLIRVTLIRPEGETAGPAVDPVLQSLLQAELAMLRQVLDAAPIMIARRDPAKHLLWANTLFAGSVPTLGVTGRARSPRRSAARGRW